MNKKILILFAAFLFLFAVPCRAADDWNGTWNRVSFSFVVTVESWGENCGDKPKSYHNNSVKPAEVIQSGKHLIFSNGGIRTDRCISPNPRLSSISESISNGLWQRTCESAKADAKFERMEYTLKATGTDTLTYVANSRFDWTLQSDHCVVSWQEKRVYGRKVADSPDAPVKTPITTPIETNSPILKIHGPGAFAKPETPSCVADGTLQSLMLMPQSSTIAPMEKICLRLVGTDQKGCHFTPSGSFLVLQNGQKVLGRINRIGCFSAGENAAESEGVYEVVATSGNRTAKATIEVAFPDLSDLARASLDLSEEFKTEGEKAATPQPDSPANGSDAAAPTEPLAMPFVAATESEPTVEDARSNTILLVGILVAGILIAAALAIFLLLKQQKKRTSSRRRTSASASFGPSRSHSAQNPTPSPACICPTCHTRFPIDATFCPHDGAALIAEHLSPGTPTTTDNTNEAPHGKICPLCHRGYDRNAKYCPHDAAELIPYSQWRKS